MTMKTTIQLEHTTRNRLKQYFSKFDDTYDSILNSLMDTAEKSKRGKNA